MKIKIISVVILLFGIIHINYGQITDEEKNLRSVDTDTILGWRRGGVISLNLSQTSLKNWAAGGQNSFALNSLISVYAQYRKTQSYWDNSLDIGYGILKQGKNSQFIKTDDKFDFLSKYGRKAFDNFFYAALFNFRTQMTVGRDYSTDTAKISNFLAPAYITGAIGLDYKPNSHFSVFVAPLTGKITIVKDQDLANAGAFGVEPAEYDHMGNILESGNNLRTEFGGYIRVIYSKNNFKSEILKNIGFTTKLDLFSNYLNNPQNIDVNWETLLSVQVNKYILVNINTHLIYDDDIDIAIDNDGDGVIEETGPRIQFKEIFGVGFAYKFHKVSQVGGSGK